MTGPGVRVLLVEDEPVLRLMVERMLRDAGADVVAVGSVEEALVALASGPPPGLVLSDLNLGPRLGTEVLERARELGIARRVLTSGDRHALGEIPEALATEVLAKPVSRAVIAALVGAVPRSATGLRRPDVGSGSSGEGTG